MIFDCVHEKDWQTISKWIKDTLGVKCNFFLTGYLGAGKTTFTRNFCEFLGVQEIVTSPSYTIMNHYHYGEGEIYHLDLYRLNSEDEVYEIGIDEILNMPETKIIEWADKFPQFMKNGYHLFFSINEDQTRRLIIQEV